MISIFLIFIASFIAATISGAAGFGGAFLLLPILTNTVGIKSAIPILTIGQLFGNASRVWFGRNELKWRYILLFTLSAIPMTIAGSYLFSEVNSSRIKFAIGLFLVFLVLYRRAKIKIITLKDKGIFIGGALTGFLSGIAGSAGPLGAAFFLGLDLKATAYVASEAFTALAIHITKISVYRKYSLIGEVELYYGLFIGMAMVCGSWVGKKIITKMSKDKFLLIVDILLIISGFQLIIS
ncbi:MAG: sulfite exporter TauE/SafE family protein [Calditerrivibrio sp.]|nr:sulfite exporter TauE/SafE family protein [Calditerrivibrio sp.]MCA1933452.1 sulfite exporter TauE/SafE family protein [Calditerrivibrio sp.]MCA1980670.1 sulfite exporter TauE/SafE family protein [Calditerrivibrio sp.]